MQGDGKIVVAEFALDGNGLADFAVLRYNTNGSLDTTFNGTGKVTTNFGTGDDYAESVMLQTDGKIVVAGSAKIAGTFDFALARYNANGSLTRVSVSMARQPPLSEAAKIMA